MLYRAKAAVCSEIRTKHSKQSQRQVEFLNVKPGGTYRNWKALKG
jgi:hypothetical protein